MRQIRLTIILPFLLFCLAFSSCKTSEILNIEVLQPGTAQFPYTNKRIVFVSPGLVKDYYWLYNGKQRIPKKSIKISLNDTVVSGFLEILKPSSRFETIILHNKPGEITLFDAKALVDEYNADGLVVFEPRLDIEISFRGYASEEDPSFTAFFIYRSEFKWKFYDKANHKFTDELTQVYTDNIDAHGITAKEAFKQLPSQNEVAADLCYTNGLWGGKQLAPSWVGIEREYFNKGSKDMKLAAKKAAENEWEEAYDIWKGVASGKKKKLREMALFNSALAWEMLGMLDSAHYYASLCYKEFENEKAQKYSNEIHERRIQQFAIKRQLDPVIPR